MFRSNLWRNKYFRWLLIFSLLAHVILYVLFFNVSFRQRSQSMIKELWDSLALSPAELKARALKREELFKKLQALKREKDNNLPAKLKPKKSDFGWVFFEDAPSAAAPGQVQVPTTEEGEVALAPTLHATELVPEKLKIPAAVQPAVEVKPAVEQPAVQQPQPEQKPVAPPVVEQPLPEPKPVAPPEPPSIAKNAASKNGLRGGAGGNGPLINKLKAFPLDNPPKSKEIVPKTEKQIKKELKARNAETSSITSLIDELRNTPAEEQQDTTQLVDDQPEEPLFAEPAPVSPEIQARIDRIAHRQEQVAHFAPTPSFAKASEGRPTTARVRGAKAMHKKDARGIIALTKGFVENLKDEGDDLIERDGDPNKRPSFEEMKYLSYESNINWCLQAAWKQNFQYNPTAHIRAGKAVIEFTIDEKGYVTASELLQSSGYPDLDKVIMKNITFANPFPPLPKHFGVKTYTTGRIIQVICNNFGM